MSHTPITVGPQHPIGHEWIEFHKSCFIGEPSKAYARRRWTITLLFDRCKQMKRSVRRKSDAIDFDGSTEDEAGAKMAAWIEEHGAVEKSPGETQ